VAHSVPAEIDVHHRAEAGADAGTATWQESADLVGNVLIETSAALACVC
jgi:hypothetical protein